MKNIICIPFAYDDKKNTGENIKNKKDYIDIYIKNFTVALISAKKHNLNDTVALVTNLDDKDIPNDVKCLFDINNIIMIKVDYNEFVFSDDYKWSLAFYKLCVLKYLSKLDYDNICYMDTDVYVQGSFKYIWSECKDKVLLYDINHGLNVNDYRIICREFNDFLKTKKDIYITHYGGEFLAISKINAKLFIDEALNVYRKMLHDRFITTKGDEFILSLVAYKLSDKIKNAGAYVFRFWTGDFRLVSTSYKFNRVIVLHVPDEKERGMVKLYSKYILKDKLPTDEKVWKTLRLKKQDIKTNFKLKIRHLVSKLLR